MKKIFLNFLILSCFIEFALNAADEKVTQELTEQEMWNIIKETNYGDNPSLFTSNILRLMSRPGFENVVKSKNADNYTLSQCLTHLSTHPKENIENSEEYFAYLRTIQAFNQNIKTLTEKS